MRKIVVSLTLWITVVGGTSCRSTPLPRPPTGPHRPHLENAVEADYPPPAALIEEIDPRVPDRDGCVWVDGAWRWTGRRWAWTQGEWVVPPQGCYHAPGELFWQPTDDGPGILYYRNPAWYPTLGSGAAETCDPPTPCARRESLGRN